MRINVALPQSIGVTVVEERSPKLSAFLKEQGIELEPLRWGGDITCLGDKPVLVRFTANESGREQSLAKFCEKHGHLVFFGDELLLPNGRWGGTDDLLAAAQGFVERARAAN
jgi:hypothetical protein